MFGKGSKEQLKRQILLDLLVTPVTCGLQAIGTSLFFIGWAFGLTPLIHFTGLVCCLAGFLIVANRFIFNYEEIGVKALKKLQDKVLVERDKELDVLDEKLTRDRDPRDQTYLRNLRALYKSFQEDLRKGNVSEYVPAETIEQIGKLFDACVGSLEQSFRLWENSRDLENSDFKKKVLEERNRIIEEVGKTVETVSETINQVRSMSLGSEGQDLAKMRSQLADGIEIARRTEKRVQAMERSDMNLDLDFDLKEYLHQTSNENQ